MTTVEQHEQQQTDDDAPAGALTTGPQQAGQIARRDFAGESLEMTSSVAQALAVEARALVEAQCILAKKWPRHFPDVRQRIMAECRRPRFAQVAMYAKPCGFRFNEKTRQTERVYAEGLSIRAAEMMLRSMGNMDSSSKVIHEAKDTRLVRVSTIDFETNARWGKDVNVPKTIERKKPKKGQRVLGTRENSYGEIVSIVEATPDEVETLTAAFISKASRTGILRLVPGDLQDEARDLIMATMKDANAKDPNAERNRVFDAFAREGIKPSDLEEWLGHALDVATRAEIDELRLLHAAIKEGEVSWAEALSQARSERDSATKDKPKVTSAPIPIPSPIPSTPTPAATSAQPAAPTPPAQPAAPKADDRPPPAEPPGQIPTRAAARSSTGRGTQAVRGALASKTPAPAKAAEEPKTRPEPAPDIKPAPSASGSVPRPADDDDDPEAEPGWMSERVQRDELPPDEPAPKEGHEDRKCASPTCSATVEVKIGDPDRLCYACSVK